MLLSRKLQLFCDSPARHAPVTFRNKMLTGIENYSSSQVMICNVGVTSSQSMVALRRPTLPSTSCSFSNASCRHNRLRIQFRLSGGLQDLLSLLIVGLLACYFTSQLQPSPPADSLPSTACCRFPYNNVRRHPDFGYHPARRTKTP